MERILALVFHVSFSIYCMGTVIWLTLAGDNNLVDVHFRPYVIASLTTAQGLHLLYFVIKSKVA